MRLDESQLARPGRRAQRQDAAAQADLTQRLAALDEVLEAGAGRLGPAVLEPARELARRAGERLRLAGSHTVVALAGSTGSGKSSLFNALSGTTLAAVGVRRPTTGAAQAVIFGTGSAGPLLDWLQVPRRHYLDVVDEPERTDRRLDGLVLLDLPDHDSTAVAHRLEVDRLVAMVDVLVWVLDPQKYADAAVHERYLRPLAGHAEVMVVVLNQADRLPAHQVDTALADVRRLLAADGLGPVPVLATSAVTPDGSAGLRTVLVEAVAAHRAVLRRVAADLDAISATLAGAVAGPAPDGLDRAALTQLTTALAVAAGVPAVGTAVRQAYLHRAGQVTGWPLLRWLRRLRPDPLRRLHLEPRPPDDLPHDGTAPARTSLPAPTAVERSRVDLALRAVADHASAQLPDPWPDAVRAAARSRGGDLTDALDRSIAGTDLGLTATPAWWRLFGGLQALVTAAAVAGGLWLAGLYALNLLRLPEPATPMVAPDGLPAIPLPTVLLIGGVLAGLLLALLARMLARSASARRGRRAEARLRTAVAAVAEDLVVDPVRAELAAYAALRAAAARLTRR